MTTKPWQTWTLSGALVGALGVFPPAASADAPERRPLAAVLRDLQASGLPIVFSEALVRPEMTVILDPRQGSLRQALVRALASQGLDVREGPGGRWLVVAAARPAPRPAAAPARGARLKLLLRAGPGEPLSPLVAVPQWGLEVNASSEGVAAVPVPPGIYRLTARLAGFLEWQADGLRVDEGREMEIPLALQRDGTAAGEGGGRGVLTLRVEVRNRHDETLEVREPVADGAGAVPLRIPAAEVQGLAGAFEDVFRALQLRPGVTPVNEAQGRFSVRSGGPDQNLVLMDGVEIYNPFRLEALVGAFNAETVESFDLTSGVMAARHGDRLASVLEVHPRPGRADRILRGTAAVDAASSGLTLEGALPGGRGASWMASARSSTPGHLMERLTHMSALQRFDDLYLRADWPWGERARLSLWTLQGREDTHDWPAIQVDQPPLSIERRFDYRARSQAWAAVVRARPTPSLSTTTVLSRYTDVQDSGERQIIRPWEVEIREREWREVQVADLAWRQEVALQAAPGRRWEGGLEVHGLDTAWRMSGKGLVLADWYLFRGPALAPTPWGSRGEYLTGAEAAVDGTRDSVRSAGWLQGAFAVGGLLVEPGLRVQHSSIDRETLLLPRARLAWRWGAQRLSAAVGWHAQSPGWEKVLLADAFLDYGGSRPGLPISSERSRQVVLGVERDLGRRLSARMEVFDTRFDRLLVGRLAAPEDEIGEAISSVPVNDGRGRARGAELWVRLGRSASAGRGLAATLAYAYGVSRREAYGRVYPFDYDRRHALALTAELPVARGLGLAAAWRVGSGLPYTPFHPVRQLPGHRIPGVRLEELNAARHPFYSRLDLRADFAPGGPRGRFQLYADVVNVLNYDITTGNNGPGFKPTATQTPDGWRVVERSDHGLAIVPTFGLRLRF